MTAGGEGRPGRAGASRQRRAGHGRRPRRGRDHGHQHGCHAGGHHQPCPPLTDEGAHPDRALDEVEGHDRDGEGHQDAQPEELVAVQPRPGVIEPNEDGPVPDVEPVRNPAHVANRRPRQHPRDEAAGRTDRGQDDAGHRQPDEEEPARVRERGGRGRHHPQGDGARRPEDAQRRRRAASPSTLRSPQLALGETARLVMPLRHEHQPHGQRAPDEEALRARVRPQIGPVGVESALVDLVHPDRRADRRRAAQARTTPAGSS